MTDRELLDAYRGGNGRSEEALRLLIERYVRLVYGACRRQLRDEGLAEDATQGVFILLSRKAGSIREDRIAGWLLTAARYACAAIRRERTRRARREEAVAVMERQEPESSDVEMEELRAHLDEGLLKLGAIDREAVVRRCLEGQSLGEVGAALHLTEEAARKRVARALEQLRLFLMKAGVACAAPGAVAGALEREAARGGAREALARTVLEGCRPGHVTTAGHGIAQGVSKMMLVAKGKVAAAVALVVGATSLAGYGGWVMVQGGSNVQAAAPQRAEPITVPSTGLGRRVPMEVRIPQIQAAPADQTTPRGAVESLARAIRSGDIKAVEACVVAPLERTESPAAAVVAWHTAEWRAKRAADLAALNVPHATATSLTFDNLVEAVLGPGTGGTEGVTIDGNMALVKSPPMPGGGAAIRVSTNAPAGVLEIMGAWRRGTIVLQKVGNEWRVDLDKTLRVETGMRIAGATPTKEELHQQVVLMEELKRGAEDAARAIENGKPVQEALQAKADAAGQLPQKYPGFHDSYSIMALPREVAEASPTP